MTTDAAFWQALDRLVQDCPTVVDRARDSHHPRIPEYVYPLDYGYLEGTTGGDGHGLDVWLGTGGGNRVTGAFATVDPYKRDAEIKVLLGCTADDVERIAAFYAPQPQEALYLVREDA